jgi:hypothetical protein
MWKGRDTKEWLGLPAEYWKRYDTLVRNAEVEAGTTPTQCMLKVATINTEVTVIPADLAKPDLYKVYWRLQTDPENLVNNGQRLGWINNYEHHLLGDEELTTEQYVRLCSETQC